MIPENVQALWKSSLVLHGGPWGRLLLPQEANVTTDRDLFQIGLVTGCPPREIRERQLLVVELGCVGSKNDMASGMLIELVLIRRDMVGAPTWLLVSDDPALDPSHTYVQRVQRLTQRWRSIRLTDPAPSAGSLETTIRVPRQRAEPEPVDVDDIVEEQALAPMYYRPSPTIQAGRY